MTLRLTPQDENTGGTDRAPIRAQRGPHTGRGASTDGLVGDRTRIFKAEELQCRMIPIADHRYNLEERTYEFASRVRMFARKLPRTIGNREDIKQVVRSSGSVGANYIEANEALSKKDFRLRIRISKKESKETQYWLKLLDTQDDDMLNVERHKLIQESNELMRIFGSILQKSLSS